jgi:hypothetical protein
MATFLNKKEQVYDLQLTPYGNYLLSIGSFKPVYYAFFDDNVIYDTRYAGEGTATCAVSTYTQLSSTISAMANKQVWIVDMEGLSHHIEFYTTLTQANSTSTVAGISDQNGSAAGILIALKKSLELARIEGKINVTTGDIDTSGDNPTMAISMGSFGNPLGQSWRAAGAYAPWGSAIDDSLASATNFIGGDLFGAPPYHGALEGQNNVNKRIKKETAYLGSQVLFRDVESTLASLEEGAVDAISYYDLTPTQKTPAADIFKFESAIGDAFLDGDARAVPAWKLLMLNSRISASLYRSGPKSTPLVGSPASHGPADKGIILNSQIPQINIAAHYSLKVVDAVPNTNPQTLRSYTNTSKPFADNKAIKIEMDDPLIYLEEVNTQLLTENFDVEVFEVESGSLNGVYSPNLHRRYFEKIIPQVENGFMVTETQLFNTEQNYTTASVEYHFDILRDSSVSQEVACQGLETFDKQSYYVDFGFNCEDVDGIARGVSYYDIYGKVTEPEICE